MKKEHTMRNIGIFAHVDAGKTTTTERILYYSGISHRIGEVDRGTAIMDWMEQEQDRGITITSAATKLLWQGCEINIIDTPGHVDFTAEVERCLRVLDGGIAIFDAVNGVEAQSETVWKQAARYHIPRLVYINKMDRIGADFAHACDTIRNELDATLLILYIPVGAENTFCGVIDVLAQKMLTWDAADYGKEVHIHPIPDDMLAYAHSAHERLIQQLADESDEVAEQYLSEEVVDIDLCGRIIRDLVCSEKAFAVFCGASLKNIGIQPLLDAVIKYLPAPEEGAAIVAHSTKDANKSIRIPRDKEHALSALIFKIARDRERGEMVYARVYAGKMRAGQRIYNASKGVYERINQLRHMHANTSKIVSSIEAGDIGVVIGLKKSHTGDTITVKEHAHLLEHITFPQPVISSSIEPKSQSDRDSLKEVLGALSKEDPTFQWRDDIDTGELIIAGMGELHLDVLATRITHDFNIQARIGKPQVTYRETICNSITEKDTLALHLAGAEHKISYECSVVPYVHEKPENTVAVAVPNTISEHRERVADIVHTTLNAGFILGYPAIHIKVDVHITEIASDNVAMALESATAQIVSRLCQKAQPIQLEPIMSITITTPKEYVGDVLSGLQQRGGITSAIHSLPSGEKILAQAPLARLFGYSTVIRSATKGKGEFNIEFKQFAPL